MSETPRPNFFIVGAAKCGTTSLFRYLAQHPEIFVSHRKEPHYFGTDLDVKPNRRMRDEAEYLDMFREGGDYPRRGEASSKYLFSEVAAKEIKAFSPDAKIIIMLRNPIDMMWSMHGQMLYGAEEDIVDFEEALAAQADRKQGRRIPPRTHGPNELQYQELATFTPQVQRFFDVFGRSNVKVIIFDDFASETGAVVCDVFQFLDVDDSFTPAIEVHNKGRWVRNPRVKQFLKDHPRIGKLVSRTFSPKFRNRAGTVLYRLKGGGPTRPDVMNPQLRRRLCSEFSEEVTRLGRLLERDLSTWTTPDAAS